MKFTKICFQVFVCIKFLIILMSKHFWQVFILFCKGVSESIAFALQNCGCEVLSESIIPDSNLRASAFAINETDDNSSEDQFSDEDKWVFLELFVIGVNPTVLKENWQRCE